MSKPFPPDDDLGPEMTPEEAFSRAMLVKLRRNREALAASGASEASAQPSAPSEPQDDFVTAEEMDQEILDRHPGRRTRPDDERSVIHAASPVARTAGLPFGLGPKSDCPSVTGRANSRHSYNPPPLIPCRHKRRFRRPNLLGEEAEAWNTGTRLGGYFWSGGFFSV